MFKTAIKRWAIRSAIFGPAMLGMSMSTLAFAGVTVSSPAPGSTTASPVHFVASASASRPISQMTIYVDNAGVYTVPRGNIDASIPMAAGQHYVVVQAWDSAGVVTKSAETITVRGGSGVTISSPAPGATVNAPIPVVASAAAPAGRSIISMKVYLDNAIAYSINAGSLNTRINASSGSHLLVIQSWDSAGGGSKSSVTVSVGGSTTPVSGSAVTHAAIQAMLGWQSCDVCAGIGAKGPAAAFSMVENQGSPSLSGRSAKFSIGGSTPYADAIWWKQLGADNAKTHFQYDVDFYLTAPQYAQALEFDANQSTGGKKFIFGTECNIKANHWDVWDTAGNTWRSTGIPCAMPSAYQWHHLTWQFYRDSNTIHFVAFTLDGVTHYVNRVYNAKPVNAQEVNVAFQMDGDYAMHSYSAWLDNVTLRAW